MATRQEIHEELMRRHGPYGRLYGKLEERRTGKISSLYRLQPQPDVVYPGGWEKHKASLIRWEKERRTGKISSLYRLQPQPGVVYPGGWEKHKASLIHREKSRFIPTSEQKTEMQRRMRILGYVGRKDVPTFEKKRVVETIIPKRHVEPVTKTITKEVPYSSLWGKKYTVGAYRQYTGKQLRELRQVESQIDTDAYYLTSFGKVVPGWQVKLGYGQLIPIAEQQFSEAYKLKPYHKIKRTKKGFDISVDYESMVKSDPGRAAALGWGWGGLGNIDIAFYKLTGQEKKAISRQASQFAQYMSAKESLARGDIGGFSLQYWGGYATMPTTQMGLAWAGGLVVGKISKAVTPVIATKGVGTQLAIRGGTLGAGATLGGMAGYYVVEPYAMRGDLGASIGRGFITTGSFAMGAAGYKSAFGGKYKEYMIMKQQRPTFIKTTVKSIPSFYKSLTKKFPGLRPSGYITGEGITPKPVGFGRTGGFIYSTGKRLGITKFGQSIYGWAAKGYVPTQTYFLEQKGVSYDKGYRIQPTLWKRKRFGFLERTWIPKEKALSFKTFIGDSGQIKVSFPTSRYLSGGDIQLTGIARGKVVKFGRGWFSHTYVSSKLEKSINMYRFSGSKLDMTKALGSYKRGGLVDVVKDVGIPRQRFNLFGEMIEKGYLSKRPIITGTKGTDISYVGTQLEYYGGFGSRYQTPIPKYPGQWAKLPKGIVKDIEAGASLLLKTKPTFRGIGVPSLKPGQYLQVPIRPLPFIPIFGLPTISLPKYDIKPISYQSYIKSPIQLSQFKSIQKITPVSITSELTRQIQVPAVIQRTIPVQAQVTIPVMRQVQIPVQKQIQTPVYLQTPMIKTISFIETPVTTIPGITVVKPPFTPPWLETEFEKKKKRKKEIDFFDIGYRFRRWKVPRLEDIMKIKI